METGEPILTLFAPPRRPAPTRSSSSAKCRCGIARARSSAWRASGARCAACTLRPRRSAACPARSIPCIVALANNSPSANWRRTAGLSRSQFGRQFQRLFRASPSEYLLRVRVNAACRLLAETDLKITDIAHETGFFDHSHFSRTFQRLKGIRPQAYRRGIPCSRLPHPVTL